jgi:hypothetical protein
MSQRFRLVGYAAVFIAGIAVGAGFAGRLAGDAPQFRTVEARTAERLVKGTAPSGLQARLELTGSGTGVSDEFDLAEGRARITVEHDGQSWFSVDLSETAHGSIGGLTFAPGGLGPWKTRTMASVAHTGRYRVHVQAGGDWKVIVAQ